MKNYKVITPLFPTYAQVKAMMKAVSGYSLKAVRNMITAIRDQTGTPQKPVDWSEPDLWISERLTGEDADIGRSDVLLLRPGAPSSAPASTGQPPARPPEPQR